MSAGDLIGWVGAVALSIVIVTRSSRTPIMNRGSDE